MHCKSKIKRTLAMLGILALMIGLIPVALAEELDYSGLAKAITDANKEKTGVLTSTDGKDVLDTVRWVYPDQMEAMDDAILAATAFYNEQSAKDQTEIDDAIAALDDVRTDFSYWIDQFGYIKAYDLFVFGSYNTMKPGGGWYAAGTTITIDAGTRSGYSFSGWTASGVTLANPNAATTTLIMPADDVEVYAHWTPTGGGFGGGGFSGGGRSSGGSSGKRPAGNAPVNVTPQAANTATQSAIAAAQAASSDDAVANIKNPGEISLATLKDMAKQAKQAGVALELQADNVNGGAVDVRLTITPKRATKDLNLSASTVNSDAARTKAIFDKSFSNNSMVVSFGQQGKFGQSVAVAAKLVSGLNTEKLVFYAYDKAANTYKRIKAPKYKIDGSGFVHFTTKLAGSIIISDGPLVKR